jgi:hypothetical protein
MGDNLSYSKNAMLREHLFPRFQGLDRNPTEVADHSIVNINDQPCNDHICRASA